MARSVVTREQVFGAADALAAVGQMPTIILVQQQIGGGSYSTVKKFLDEWHAARTEQAALPPLPDALQQRGSELLRRLWALALAQDEVRVKQVCDEAQRQVEEAMTRLHGAEQTIALLELEFEEALQQTTKVQAVAEDLRGQLSATQAAAQVAEARTKELEQQVQIQRAELAEARAQLLVQAQQIGELDALRRQVDQQTALLARLDHKEVSA